MKKPINICVLITWSIFIFFLNYPFCQAQHKTDTIGLNPSARILFQSDDLIELTISFNMNEVLRDIGDERIDHGASISYTDNTGQEKSLPISIRTRGHFRRDPTNCNFPPLRLDFSESATENTIFEDQKELKLVTHCRTRSDKFEQIVIKEYLAYRIYNLLTDESFRVKLARITYEDTDGKKPSFTQFGFIIEPAKQMAARNGCDILDNSNVHQERTDKEKMMILCIFQYLIGNTDWSVPALHNIVLLTANLQNPPVAVPYDFDWSGMVNAPYAYPAPQLGLDNVTQRLFRGYCRPESEYLGAFEIFREKKADIYTFCENFPYLNQRELKILLNYFDQFYKIIENQKSIQFEFYLKCRKDE
jgi:hypothetical protein